MWTGLEPALLKPATGISFFIQKKKKKNQQHCGLALRCTVKACRGDAHRDGLQEPGVAHLRAALTGCCFKVVKPQTPRSAKKLNWGCLWEC